jgi:glycosyltransferase involved in cell wall biosynthesis
MTYSHDRSPGNEMIRFSIIIPTYNRSIQLGSCLASLTCLDFAKDLFEIVVVDDGSAFSMDKVVEPYRQTLNIKLLAQANSGPGVARNSGVAKAEGKFIAFIDDDCMPDRGWLKMLSERVLKDPERMYGGNVVNALGNNIYSAASQLLIDYLYAYYNSEPEHAHFFTSNNMVMSRNIFLEVGGFNTEFPNVFGEDRELCDRWLSCGYGLSYVPEAIVYHYHDLNLEGFCRQHFRYGGGAVRFHQGRALRNQESFRIEPLTFYLDLIFSAWRMKRPRPLSLTALLVLSQLLNAAGFAYTRIRGQK